MSCTLQSQWCALIRLGSRDASRHPILTHLELVLTGLIIDDAALSWRYDGRSLSGGSSGGSGPTIRTVMTLLFGLDVLTSVFGNRCRKPPQLQPQDHADLARHGAPLSSKAVGVEVGSTDRLAA